jgi:hypothetical protein
MMYGALSSENIFRCVSDECGDFEHCFSIHQIVCGSQMQVVMLQCTSDEFHVEGTFHERIGDLLHGYFVCTKMI